MSIFAGDHADSDVKGFLVEYRPEKEKNWQIHPGIIPYKGPNHQYRVQVGNGQKMNVEKRIKSTDSDSETAHRHVLFRSNQSHRRQEQCAR